VARTFLRQDTQIRNSDTYNDAIAPAEAAFETNPTNIETDLNNLRSANKNLKGTTNWYDTPTRDVETLNTDLADMETKKFFCPVQVLTNVTVGGSDNYVVLSVAGVEAPTDVIAIALTQLGAVTALLPGGSGTHSLNEIASTSAIRPKNIVTIRDSTTKDAITSGGFQVYGLLQAESVAVDGDAFDDTTKQGQISFVRNDGSDDLEACPAADIQGKTIEYMYAKRVTLDTIPEDCSFPLAQFADQVASVDVTLDNAIDSQGTTVATQGTNIDIKQAAGVEWAWQDQNDADILNITEGSGGSDTELAIGSVVDLYDNDAIDVDFASGIKAASGTTQINVGVTAGQIDSAGALKLLSASGGDLTIESVGDVIFVDENYAGSTYDTPFNLSDASSEWDLFETNYGEVSLLNAINQSFSAAASFNKTCSTVNSTETQDTDIGGTSGGANLDDQIHDISGGSFLNDHDVFLNGDLLRGAAVLNTHDYYPGTSLALGQLKFDFTVKANDELCVISRA
jgi:hypothetical protein